MQVKSNWTVGAFRDSARGSELQRASRFDSRPVSLHLCFRRQKHQVLAMDNVRKIQATILDDAYGTKIEFVSGFLYSTNPSQKHVCWCFVQTWCGAFIFLLTFSAPTAVSARSDPFALYSCVKGFRIIRIKNKEQQCVLLPPAGSLGRDL